MEMEKTKSASCLFLFSPKPQSFVVFVSVHKKNRHFKVSIECITLICTTKIDGVFLMSFALVLKKTSWYPPAIQPSH